jgi:hypothetical protein
MAGAVILFLVDCRQKLWPDHSMKVAASFQSIDIMADQIIST